jgi:UDP-N-acetylmuramoyl-tripeptide--D-alanyl-D-alanine ligase
MMLLLSQAAKVLNGRLIGADCEFATVSTDSRAVRAGDLFVALRGENFDGSAFVAAAGTGGAAAALINADSYREGVTYPVPLLLVEDTRLALGQLAAYWRRLFTLPMVAITGSNGKTTVKEMLAAILREAAGNADAVLATRGNLNNDIGLPLTLLKLCSAHRYAVVEMGMNHSGEIAYLTELARPDVAVVNNASGAHLLGLGSVEGVARAKGEIFAGLSNGSIAIINADDEFAPLWREMSGSHKTVEFGLEHFAPVHGQWQVQGYGARIAVDTPQGSFAANLQVPGAHNARNALAAAAAACVLRVPLAAIKSGLEKFSGVAGRLQRKQTSSGALLLDDTYNANPASLYSALNVLMQAAGKKVLVLGDMGELGDEAARLHGEIGVAARRMGVDALLALGTLSARAVQEFGAGAHHFERIEDLYAALDACMDAGSTVLVKGSRFMHMERVVQHCTPAQ